MSIKFPFEQEKEWHFLFLKNLMNVAADHFGKFLRW